MNKVHKIIKMGEFVDMQRRRMQESMYEEDLPSYFDGGLLSLIGWKILGVIVTVFTLGLGFPWAMSFVYGWEVRHTVINGRRLEFSGTGLGLFCSWIKWWFFILITLGIYAFWVEIKLLEWKISHTYFVDEFIDF